VSGVWGSMGGSPTSWPVHPRVCGAEAMLTFSRSTWTGSPPRGRGGVTQGPPPVAQLRFTPACAGRRTRVRVVASLCMVHPRVCGAEHGPGRGALSVRRFTPACAGRSRSARSWITPQRGSPPRVRGGGNELGVRDMGARFTPACAGRRGNARRQPV